MTLVEKSRRFIAGVKTCSINDLLLEWIAYSDGIEMGIKHDAALIREIQTKLNEVIVGKCIRLDPGT